MNNRCNISLFLYTSLFFVGVLENGCTSSAYKTLETSGKKPEWLNGVEENYIIAYGQGSDAEQAKNECLKTIRDQVVSAIAINVRSKTEVNINQRNGVTDEQFKTSIVSQSADIPSLQGISITNVKDYYWEKVLDKNDNRIKFGYHIKYPFPKSELARLLDEYNKADEAVSKFINHAAASLDTISSLDVAEANISKLTAYEKRLIDSRKEQCALIAEQLRTRVKNIHIEIKDISDNDALISLKLANNTLRTSKTIQFKSNCAKNITYSKQGNDYYIKWDASLCKYTDAPNISFNMVVNDKSQTYSNVLDFSKNKVNFALQGDLRFLATSKDAGNVQSIQVEMVINPAFDTPFKLYKAEFNFKGLLPVAIVLDEKINAKSVKSVKGAASGLSLPIEKTSSAKQAFPYIDGALYYENMSTGKKDIYKFQNYKYVTDW